jgi:hypothetical protein
MVSRKSKKGTVLDFRAIVGGKIDDAKPYLLLPDGTLLDEQGVICSNWCAVMVEISPRAVEYPQADEPAEGE